MKKLKKIILFSILTLFIALPNVFAKSYYGVVNTDALMVRSGPGTNYGKVTGSLSLGTVKDLVSDTKYNDEGGCEGEGWYQIYYSGTNIGYVCSLYFDIYEKKDATETPGTPTNDCEQGLADKGFPSSYWSGLCALKEKHPNWNFEVLNTEVDFNVAVSSESSCGKCLMNTSNANYINYNCSRTDYSGYKTLSSGVVAYYLDPRNFFNDSHIFMFESQYYNSDINDDGYISTTARIYNNNFMISQIPSLPNYILNAGKDVGMSPIAITSRMYQELGNGKLTSGAYAGQLYSAVSGNYTTRYPEKKAEDGHSLDHYYNFYNIAASDTCSSITDCALKYAYSHGWGGSGDQNADRQTAVTEGARWIKNRYLDAGQASAYLQKFNVKPNSSTSLFINQYMTNIEAPKSEATTLYKAYSNLNWIDSSHTFYIPVFENMPNSTSLPTSEANKNFNGIGDNITIDSSKPAVNDIVNGAGYTYRSGYISKINIQTEVASIKTSLENMGASVTIQDNNAKEVTSGIIGTGYKITINGSNSETLEAIVYGDASGDGKINSLDLLKIQKHILKSATLSGAKLSASDTSRDGKVNALDLLKVQKYILGSGTIEQ